MLKIKCCFATFERWYVERFFLLDFHRQKTTINMSEDLIEENVNEETVNDETANEEGSNTSKLKRFQFRPLTDIMLLKQVHAELPYIKRRGTTVPQVWVLVVDALNK